MLLLCAGVMFVAPAAAQTARPPAAPIKPAAERTVTATRLSKPLDLDGKFDEDVYRSVQPANGFIQQDPMEGVPASEPTDLWVFFDDKNIYFAGKCYDSHPEREIETELRRDSAGVFQNDSIAIVIDTFRDRRNGFKFQTNALGSVQESSVVDEVNNDSWNTVWEVRSGRYDWGWGFEIAVPFKSLRYPGSGPQTWGINMRRNIKWKNELDYLMPMPRSFGVNAIYHLGFTGTLAGVETPKESKNIELKPYAVSSLTTDRTAATPFNNKKDGNIGFDFKYGLTRSLILDTTYRTDFAQIEEDQQQVNLTRFSLFFPEKRDFFLEGQAIFAFGGTNFGQNSNPGEVPVLFFSRRIGLNNGLAVPVEAGVRLTGKTGKYAIGAVNIQTSDDTASKSVSTNFTAMRVKRDFLRRSNIGFIATRRSPMLAAATPGGSDTNYAVGVDSNLFLFKNVTGNLYYARTDTPGKRSGQDSYRGRYEFAGDRWGYVAEHLLIGPNFNPEIGYVKRVDFRRSFGQVRFSPRPKQAKRVRQYSYILSQDYITDAGMNVVQAKELRGQFTTTYQNGDSLLFDYKNDYELLPGKFVINPGTVVPKGGYDYQSLQAKYTVGQQRKISGSVALTYGTLYNGKKTEAAYTGRMAFVPQFAVEPSISLNWVRLPYGDFEAPVIGTRVIYTPNARTGLTSLVQYNGSSRTLSSSVRLRWEYRGGSELFVVYSDGRNTALSGYPELQNRSIALKVTRLLRF